MESPMVSVYCLAFNHAPYIRQALDGLVSQKTSFPYEIIVHDDASTDGTADIIREYAQRYPELIRPVLQTENQFSRGVLITRTIIYPMIRGKYMAACEGDDYWTDPDKLQLQVDYMEAHPECSLCVHNTEYISADDQPLNRFSNNSGKEQDYTTESVILAHGGGLYHTSSMLGRTEIWTQIPDAFRIRGIGDYPTGIWFSTQGTVHYIDRVMSRYRTMVPGSWTVRNVRNPEKYVQMNQRLIDAITVMDDYTQKRYHKPFAKAQRFYRYRILKARRNVGGLLITPSLWGEALKDAARRLGKRR